MRSTRPALRDFSQDPGGDAIADYSNLGTVAPSPANVKAMDFRSQAVDFESDLATGARVKDGGFTVTLQLADLADAALSDALSKTKSGSLLWIFRFVNGYQASAAVARYGRGGKFSFGYNDYTTGSAECGSNSEKCQVYPGDKPLKGKVDRKAGTIVMNVPRSYLVGLVGPTGPGQRPTLVKAVPGTRFYDGTAFSLGSVSPDPTAQTFLYPIDNPPVMDFELPGRPGAGGAGAGGGLPACAAAAGFRSVKVRPRRHGFRIGFVRRQKDRPVTVDVFRESTARGKVLDQRRVARFTGRRKGFTWNGRRQRGRPAVGRGYYFVRLAVPTSGGRAERRRVTLERRGSRFRRRPAFALRERCGTLQSFKLVRPVFGGTNRKRLGGSYRLSHRARVSLWITRGKKTVRRFKTRTRRAHTTYRIALQARAVPRGAYKVRIRVTRGRERIAGTVTGRKL